MKRILFYLSGFVCQMAFAQKDSISLDQLQVPSSPAFNILDISPNSIERPKNPTDFALSLGNATSGFSTIPKNYAMELAPFWFFGKKKKTYDDFVANQPAKNVLQTATFSLGTKDAKSIVDSSEFRKVAVALKFSVWRGELGSDFKRWNDSVYRYLGKISKGQGEIFIRLKKVDKRLLLLEDSMAKAPDAEKIRFLAPIDERTTYLEKIAQDSINTYKEEIAVLKGLMSRTDFRRYGFKMDYAIGTAIDYPDSSFKKSYVSKISTWLTLGFEKEGGGLNWLVVVRYNYNLNRFYRNDANALVKDINIGELDYGLRLYADVSSKFTLSFEVIKRKKMFNENKLNSNNVKLPENTDRYVVSANYKVGKNQNLSFTYGKNFDNTVTRGGNLITALNFLIGFGSNRPVVHSPE